MTRHLNKVAAFLLTVVIFKGISPAAIDINISPTSWDVGSGAAGSWVSPSPFTIQNNGEQVKINVRATDKTNSSDTVWKLSSAPGLNAFSIQWGTEPDWNSIYTADTNMFTLPVSGSENFYLKYRSPSAISPLTTASQSSNIKFTAVSPYIGDWQVMDIGMVKAEGKPALAVDSDGNLHVAYYDGYPHALKYAAWDGASGATFSQQIISDVDVSMGERGIAIVVDSLNHPHIFYIATEIQNGYGVGVFAKYLNWNGSNWISAEIASDVDVYNGIGLNLDAEGTPHVVYVANDLVRYAFFNGTSWAVEDVGQGGGPFFALDYVGKPHLTYVGPNNELYYATRDPVTQQWSSANIRNHAEPRGLALDAQNKPYILNSVQDTPIMEIATLNSSGIWVFSAVDNLNMQDPSFALDANGYPNLAYGLDEGGIGYKQWTGAEWLYSKIDSNSGNPALDFDVSGRPRIIYSGSTDGDEHLKYARWE